MPSPVPVPDSGYPDVQGSFRFPNHVLVPLAYFEWLVRKAYGGSGPVGPNPAEAALRRPPASGSHDARHKPPAPSRPHNPTRNILQSRLPDEWKPVHSPTNPDATA